MCHFHRKEHFHINNVCLNTTSTTVWDRRWSMPSTKISRRRSFGSPMGRWKLFAATSKMGPAEDWRLEHEGQVVQSQVQIDKLPLEYLEILTSFQFLFQRDHLNVVLQLGGAKWLSNQNMKTSTTDFLNNPVPSCHHVMVPFSFIHLVALLKSSWGFQHLSLTAKENCTKQRKIYILQRKSGAAVGLHHPNLGFFTRNPMSSCWKQCKIDNKNHHVQIISCQTFAAVGWWNSSTERSSN